MADDAQQPINLTNHFLIAMPGMEDGTFTRSVIYVCEHSERGALGLIINKPGDISLADLFERVDLPLERPELGGQPVFHGGPLQTERGFVLHEPIVAEGLKPDESIYASTLTVPGLQTRPMSLRCRSTSMMCSARSFTSASSSRSSASSSAPVLPRRRVPAIGRVLTRPAAS